jgi:serine 3-dehydrogenase
MKTAWITGATSGFGRAATKRFVEGGWQVIASGRRIERLYALRDELGAERVHVAAFDIRDADAMNLVISRLPDDFRAIDLLINSAGLALGTGPAQGASLDDWRTMIDTNITALVTLTRALLPTLVAQRGAIVNVSSTAALYPYMGGNVYGASKAFVSQFSLNLRADLHGSGVRVTTLEPGMAETEFTLVRTHGDQAASDKLYEGAHPITDDDVAETLWWIATLPPHLNVNRLELMPTSQSFAGFQIHREA